MKRRGRKRDPWRLERDLTIHLVLSQSDPKHGPDDLPEPLRSAIRDSGITPGRVVVGGITMPRRESVSEAARALASYWAEVYDYHEEWQSIRARYYKLKKADPNPEAVPDYVKKRL